MVKKQSLVDLDKAHLIHPLTHPRHFELHHPPRIIVEGEGVMIRDSEGREIIDGFSGLWSRTRSTRPSASRWPRSNRSVYRWAGR